MVSQKRFFLLFNLTKRGAQQFIDAISFRALIYNFEWHFLVTHPD